MKEQIIFHRKQYLKNNRLQYLQKRSLEPEQNHFIFLTNNRVLRGPFRRRIFLSTLASRFRVKTLHQSYKAGERGCKVHASLQCQLFEWTGRERAVEIEPKMTAFQRAAVL